jgi:2-methylisocitrate lyase-like PEP mutase family enzyme
LTPADRTARFRALHASGCFVMPNPWDVGSARWLRARGFPALASTSAGFAFTQGRADQDVPLAMMLDHLRELVAAVPDLPVNADFENAYANDPQGVAANVTACVATGVAGLSVEDALGHGSKDVYPFALALDRVKAARAAIDATRSGVVLTARAEGVLVQGRDALPDVLKRIAAFAEAGADCLYAPGVKTREDIAAVIAAAGAKPVNVLVFGEYGITVADVAALGGRRISIGAALARAAWAAFVRATEAIKTDGSFRGFAENATSAPLNEFFRKDLKDRGA